MKNRIGGLAAIFLVLMFGMIGFLGRCVFGSLMDAQKLLDERRKMEVNEARFKFVEQTSISFKGGYEGLQTTDADIVEDRKTGAHYLFFQGSDSYSMCPIVP